MTSRVILLLFGRIYIMLLGVNMTTLWSKRAKSGYVIHAHHSLRVLVPTIRSVATEAPVVPRAILFL